MLVVVIDGKRTIDLGVEDRLTIGRLDDPVDGVVGLDPLDRAISRKAVRLARTDAGWVVENISRSRPAYVEHLGGGALLPLPPGGRHLVDQRTTAVEVRGQVLTHRVDLLAGDPDPTQTRRGSSDLDTVTDNVTVTPLEREALITLYRGYLERFPRRDCQPLTYEQAAAKLGLSAATVRRRVERVRDRLRRHGVFIDGPGAKFQLVEFLLGRGYIGPDDLDVTPVRGEKP